MLTRDYYSTILSQVISPCKNYLITGDTYGRLSIFFISKITQPDAFLNKDDLKPRNKIIVKEEYQINSLASTPHFLLVGTVGEVFAYPWKAIKSTKPQGAKPDWIIEIPDRKDSLESFDINAIIYDEDTGNIFLGCGDNKIYVYDLEHRKLLKILSKHSNYIHCLSKSGTDLISGGEDGVVNIWDLRTHEVTNKIEPYLKDSVSRPTLGKWIGAVSSNDDYILCGGGPRLSLWHYRFLTNSTIFPIEDKGIHVAEIYNEKFLAGGTSRLFYHMSCLGDIISEIPVSAYTIYSIVHQEEPSPIFCLAGSSPKIDVCNNFLYKNQQLCLY